MMEGHNYKWNLNWQMLRTDQDDNQSEMPTQNINIDNYSIQISPSIDLETLKRDWTAIQKLEDVPFFLTWSWVNIWLKTYNPKKLVVTARFGEEVVAIGLFTFSNNRSLYSIKTRQLRLHQTGDSQMDQIWMEYNDFLCTSEHRTLAVNACLKALRIMNTDWDELVISMMTLSRGSEVVESNDTASIYIRRPCYTCNLQSIRDQDNHYLQSLTSNTRYQIRRSIRQYEKLHGELSLQVARDQQQALDFFQQAGPFHLARWEDSGYKNKLFIDFHRNLIRTCFNDNSIDLLRVNSGNTTIAIMYYHIVGKKVFFYLHGLHFEDDPKLKPGLVAHSLASQYYLEQGMDIYDYMGGYSQYKHQLARQSEDLVTVIIQRSRSRFRLERMARNFKNWIIPPSD